MKTKPIVLFLFALATGSVLSVWEVALSDAPAEQKPTVPAKREGQSSADAKLAPGSLQIEPPTFALAGKWASQTRLATARLSDGTMRDLSPQAEFRSRDTNIAAVSKEGVVTPIADGRTTIAVTAKAGDLTLSAEAQVTVQHAKSDAVDFLHDVMPLVSRLGCNSVGCHGSQKGKGGLTLSMFGADPRADYDAFVTADGGRRVNQVEPRKSLFLLKATGSLPHKP